MPDLNPDLPGATPWPPASAERLAHLAGVAGVLTDIDDTLTRDGAIEPAAMSALHALARARLPVIAITGRPAGWSEPFALAWPVAGIVAENGGVMLRRAADGTLQRDFAQGPAERAANWQRLQACAAAVLREVPGATLAHDSAGRLTDIAVDHSEFAHLNPAQIDAVCEVMRSHGLTATVSSIHVNGWIGTHSKWSAAEWAVAALTGRPFVPADWLYVGDSTNDQMMFERLPLSVGVANIARFWRELRVKPAWVTRGERGEGFAEVAAALLAAR
ncbi:HAD-IIB family hydrolase [Ideonella sp.]|uniref:HAD-IIB family hydrolase n=1 Tax=Ideonella sp. TaxID=1929293 RepID=UPI002B461BC2|nr:HAD-IIB family hydrolase [Ideonella sp.]HJV71765.1 HAD-IIB family hydrolase [Ideonella sp.]